MAGSVLESGDWHLIESADTRHASGPTLTSWDHDIDRKLDGLSGPGGVALAFTYDGHLLTDAVWSGFSLLEPWNIPQSTRTLAFPVSTR